MRFNVLYGIANRIWGSAANDELHAFVYRETRKESLRDLTQAEFYSILSTLQKTNSVVGGLGRASPKQIAKIAKTGYLLGWSSRGIRRFLSEHYEVDDWHNLSSQQAVKVIRHMGEILKAKQGKK